MAWLHFTLDSDDLLEEIKLSQCLLLMLIGSHTLVLSDLLSYFIGLNFLVLLFINLECKFPVLSGHISSV